jgi:hypothetical protein
VTFGVLDFVDSDGVNLAEHALSLLSRGPMMSPRPRDSPLLDLDDVYNDNQGTGSFGGALWAISHRSF